MPSSGREATWSPSRLASSGPSRLFRLWSPGVVLAALLLAAAPGEAWAGISLGERAELGMYGRIGLAWGETGEVIQGKSLNITGGPLGGRLEEGDYLEPTLQIHVLKPDTETGPYAKIVFTPAIFARSGSFLGAFTNNQSTLGSEIFQAYLEAGNFLVPDLKVWAGARFYRGADVHIADNFFFNNLSSQGAGLMYGPVDVAVLLQTGAIDNPLYGYDSNNDGLKDATRQRTIFVGQYVYSLGGKNALHGLGEFHLLPAARKPARPEELPSDVGWVVGTKAHFEWEGGNFNDVSVRYGGGIANGTIGGAPTWATFGLADPDDGRFSSGGALGLEVVEHFVLNVAPNFSVNGYGMLHFARGASGASADRELDYTVGARTFYYLSDKIHLINEAHFSGRKIGDAITGTMVKLTVMPTLVPTGERSVWARPHLRLFYTIAFYNEAAQNQTLAPYLQAFGPRAIGHYVGTRAEWWF